MFKEYMIYYRANGKDTHDIYEDYSSKDAIKQCQYYNENALIDRIFTKTEEGWEEIPDWQWRDFTVNM